MNGQDHSKKRRHSFPTSKPSKNRKKMSQYSDDTKRQLHVYKLWPIGISNHRTVQQKWKIRRCPALQNIDKHDHRTGLFPQYTKRIRRACRSEERRVGKGSASC